MSSVFGQRPDANAFEPNCLTRPVENYQTAAEVILDPERQFQKHDPYFEIPKENRLIRLGSCDVLGKIRAVTRSRRAKRRFSLYSFGQPKWKDRQRDSVRLYAFTTKPLHYLRK